MVGKSDSTPSHYNQPRWRVFLDVLVPAFFSSVMVLIGCVAFASLIFSGRAQEFLGAGITILVIGSIVVGLIYGFNSEYRMLVVQPDDDTAAIYAAMVAALALVLPVSLSAEAFFWHALILILLTTFLTGVTLTALGVFKAGAAVEFLPYSVMGGYFATAGWLLAVGGIQAGTGVELTSLQHLPVLHSADWIMLLATLLIALFLFAVRGHKLKNLFLVLVLSVSVGAFYSALLVFPDAMPEDVLERFTLGNLQPAGNGSGFGLSVLETAISNLRGSDYAFLQSALPSFPIIVLLSCVSTLLTISGLNLLLQHDAQVDRELRRIGSANMVSAFAGGMAAFPSLTLTNLARTMGAPTTRWFAPATVGFLALMAWFALPWLGYLPKPVVGGLLLSMGLGFLYEWLIQARTRYLLHEYLVIPTILLVAIFFGFLQGVLVGLLAATVLFVIKYSQTQVIRFEGDGQRFRSNVDRNGAQLEILQDHGPSILVIGLQGYLFFGTSGRIYSRVKELLESQPEVKTILLDFDKVNGVDASAELNFEKLAQLVTLKQVYLLIAGLDQKVLGNLSSTGINLQDVAYAHVFDDIDRALEWHEERLIVSSGVSTQNDSTFVAQLGRDDQAAFQQFSTYLKKLDVEAGHVLAEQGAKSDELYLLETCGASAYIDDGSGGRLRVRRVVSGAIYGEIGFFLGTPRTATIVTDMSGSVYILSREQYQAMEKEAPDLIAQFQRYLLGLSIERLLFTTQTLSTVMR